MIKDMIDFSEEERVKTIAQYMKEEVEAFAKAGHGPFTEDDITYAAYLREQIDFDQAFLSILQKGDLTCRLDREDFRKSVFLPTSVIDGGTF